MKPLSGLRRFEESRGPSRLPTQSARHGGGRCQHPLPLFKLPLSPFADQRRDARISENDWKTFCSTSIANRREEKSAMRAFFFPFFAGILPISLCWTPRDMGGGSTP